MDTGELMQVLAAMPGGDSGDWCAAELAEFVPVFMAFEAQAAAFRMQLVAKADAVGVGADEGFRSTADWLTKTTGVGHAGGMVATARALRDDLHATAQALAAGEIREDHVGVIRRGHRVFGEDFARIEESVVDAARSCSARELRRFIDRVIQQYRPDNFDDDTADAQAKRKLFLSKGLDGWWHLTGLLDPATGEKVKAALDVYADKTSDDDGRLPAARRADALAEIAERAVAEIDRPTGHGTLTLTMSQEQFDTGIGASWTGGALLSRDEVAEHSCETDVAVVIRDGWQPLRLGFTARFATRAQRIALQARDGDTCIHPGCSTQASRCIAHHIVHWNHGGPTDIDNMALVCRFHHERIHHGRLTITQEDGRYTTDHRKPQPA